MRRFRPALATLSAVLALGLSAASAADEAKPIKALIITGDNVPSHDWPGTTESLRKTLSAHGLAEVEVTSTPSKDLTDENLSKYDVLVLNYANTKNGSPESKWSDANKQAFLKAVKGGKGLVVVHFASAAFARPNDAEFEKAIAGGWRTQGYHGPAHEYTVKKTDTKHPVSTGAPDSFAHVKDELYQNSLLTPGSTVLATAYSDPDKPKGTGKDEAVIWVNSYGDGRVFNIALGHDVAAQADPGFRAWLRRGTEWAATGKVDPKTK
jgi:type 1 glutamine amidotransferase